MLFNGISLILQGEVREDLPGECCGRCKPTGCVVNGTVYSVCYHISLPSLFISEYGILCVIDWKPETVLLSESGTFWVVDWKPGTKT